MGIAAVETRLAAVVAQPELINGDRALAKPELTLRLTACEDDVRELFDLLSQCRVGGLTHTGCAVVGTTSYSDQDVLLRPIALAENLPQLGEINLELSSAVGKRGLIISYCGIGALAKSDQLLASTVKAVAIRIELKACEDAPDLGEMIRIFGANQKMEVHEARPRRHIEPHLDIREDKLYVGQDARRLCCRTTSS